MTNVTALAVIVAGYTGLPKPFKKSWIKLRPEEAKLANFIKNGVR